MESEVKPDLRIGYIGAAVILVLMLAMSAWGWAVLPSDARLPVHWNLHGVADQFAGKTFALLLNPVMMLVGITLFLVLPRIEPRRLNLAKSARVYSLIWVSIMAILLVCHVVILLGGFGYQVPIGRVLPFAMGLLFAVMGNFFGKIRSNFFMGFRTPWTLSSELSWNKTHRLAGWLFFLFGIALMIMSLIASAATIVIFAVAAISIVAVIPLVYSYLVWKSDPDKQPVGWSRRVREDR